MSGLVHRMLCAIALAAPILLAPTARAEPSSSLHEAAASEGMVRVYGATDEDVVRPLIRDFEQRYPGVRVEFEDMSSGELYRRFLDEAREGGRDAARAAAVMDDRVAVRRRRRTDCGAGLDALPGGRHAGQWVIGAALGLYFSPLVLAQLAAHRRNSGLPATVGTPARLTQI